jgi:hypothetical protein
LGKKNTYPQRILISCKAGISEIYHNRIGVNLGNSGFARNQYSLWDMDRILPSHAYTSMVNITRTNNLLIGMVPTIENGLAMSHQPYNAVMDVKSTTFGWWIDTTKPSWCYYPHEPDS